MESINGFEKTELDGHAVNFTWTVDLKKKELYGFYNYNNTRSMGNRVPEDYYSPEFKMSNTCPAEWIMILREVSNHTFKISLLRRNPERRSAVGFCSVYMNLDHEKIKKALLEVSSGENGFSPEIELYPRQDNYSFTKVYIDGIINIKNSCEIKKKSKVPQRTSQTVNISQLQHDFKTLFKAKQITDVTLNVGDEDLPAHKFVLSARSPVFQRMFSQDMVEGNQNSVRVKDIDKSVMEVFLSFLYTGVIEDREFNTIFELYSVADKYEVTTLFKTCREILTSHISIRTVTPVLKLADMHSDDELKDFAVQYICDNFSKVETTAEWEELLDKHPRLASHTLRKVSSYISK